LNVTDVLPAGIVTVVGAVTDEVSELVRVTVMPPVGAGPERVTVPVTTVEEPPTTVVG